MVAMVDMIDMIAIINEEKPAMPPMGHGRLDYRRDHNIITLENICLFKEMNTRYPDSVSLLIFNSIIQSLTAFSLQFNYKALYLS